MALHVQHDCENYAYIVEHEEFGKLVFATDLTRFPYKIKDVNVFLLECNYDENIIIDNLCKGYDIRSHNENHLELEDTIDAIRRNLNPNLMTLCLIHLSDSQSNEKAFRERIFSEFGIDCYIASRGLEINLNKEDF